MITRETTDIDDIRAVLCNPAIYDCISSDSSPSVEEFIPPISDDYLYVGGYVEGKIIALMVYHTFRDGTKIHIQVIPEYRDAYGIEFGRKALLFKQKATLYAVIPDTYKNVLNYAESFGFKVIERSKSDETKNGKSFIDNVLKYISD